MFFITNDFGETPPFLHLLGSLLSPRLGWGDKVYGFVCGGGGLRGGGFNFF